VRTLVTGGAGFIGSHLVEHLLQLDDEVVVLDDLSTGTMHNLDQLSYSDRLTMVVGSILDRGLVDRVVAASDRVFHLAAPIRPRAVADQPLHSLRTNLHGTEHVLDAAHEHRKPVLLASTSEVYGKNGADRLSEDADRVLGSPLTARWAYAAAKGMDEALAYAYFREYGLPVVIARLFNVVGPRQHRSHGTVVPTLISQALRDEPVTVFGDGEQTRCFTYVGDVVPALARLADSPAALGRAVNLGGSQEISINTLANRVVAVLSSASPIVHLPYSMAYGPGYQDTRRRIPDNTLATMLVGFDPVTTIDEVILHVADALMARGALGASPRAGLWAS